MLNKGRVSIKAIHFARDLTQQHYSCTIIFFMTSKRFYRLIDDDVCFHCEVGFPLRQFCTFYNFEFQYIKMRQTCVKLCLCTFIMFTCSSSTTEGPDQSYLFGGIKFCRYLFGQKSDLFGAFTYLFGRIMFSFKRISYLFGRTCIKYLL